MHISVIMVAVSFRFYSKLNFRMLYDFDLNEAIDIYDLIT